MSNNAIRVEGLGKRYRIGASQKKAETFRQQLKNLVASPLDYLYSTLRPPSEEETFWALKDVSFEVERGEVVGIIGRNGSGKSTLLKILSRITEPTTGRAEIYGRIGSLLEVGTGFHPELTGRENIYMNGAILGMRKSEIDNKFDDIMAFAEVDKFIDTPVKRYSSGMYVRLAFSVAAHLETEILLVDEVLAVGDIAFQKKCMGKMGNVAREGRTVLFVSHNMGAVARLCHRGFLLDQGKLVFSGRINEAIAKYTENVLSSSAELYFDPDPEKKVQLRALKLLDHQGTATTELDRNHSFSVLIQYEVGQHLVGAHVGVMLDKIDGMPICHSVDVDTVLGGIIDRKPGLYRSVVEFPGGLLNAGTYQIRVGIAKYGGEVYDYCEAFVFHLNDDGSFASMGVGGQQRPGLLALPLKWSTESITAL